MKEEKKEQKNSISVDNFRSILEQSQSWYKMDPEMVFVHKFSHYWRSCFLTFSYSKQEAQGVFKSQKMQDSRYYKNTWHSAP